jgi:hypothetical protein
VVSEDSEVEGAATRKVRKVSGVVAPADVKTRATKKTRTVKKPDSKRSAAKKPKAPTKWEDIFTPRDTANYEKSLGESRDAISEGETERNLLRKLQTEGWTSKQSRYIVNEADLS